MAPPKSGYSFTEIWIKLEFGNGLLVFEKRGKLKYPEKNLSEQTQKRTNNKLNPHMASSPGIDHEPHRREASALTTKWLETENGIEIGLKLTITCYVYNKTKNLFTLIDGEPILIDTQWLNYK